MSLTDNFMLPKRVCEMAQMADLLQAEQRMLDRLYALLQELLAQGSINNNTTLTKAELERICTWLTGCSCRVDEFAEKLTVHICVKRNSGRLVSIRALIDGIKALIPAHLKYDIVMEYMAGIDIKAGQLRRKIRYDLCNQYLCGERPNIAWQGRLNDEGINIEPKAPGWLFQPAMPGGKAGGIADEQIAAAALPFAFKFNPDKAQGTGGGIKDSGFVPEVKTEAFVFAGGFCGEGYAREDW